MDPVLWMVVYLTIGFLWCAWQSKSQFSQEVTRQIPPWASFVSFMVVLMLWPIGAGIYGVLKAWSWKRRRAAMRRIREHPELQDEDDRRNKDQEDK